MEKISEYLTELHAMKSRYEAMDCWMMVRAINKLIKEAGEQ